MKTIKEPARDIPVRAEADVLVVGGGPAGIMAAEAAAGDGLRVMLVESRGFLGGNLTIGLPILGFLGRKGNQIIEGSAQRFIDRLRARGAASEHRPCKNHMSLTIIDEEEVKRTALEIMEEKGVEVLLYTFFADAIREGDAVKGVVVESKAGREAILAKTVIDCTGDGDVAFRAGVECRKGDAEGGMQPPTQMFCMKGVDVQRLRDAIVGHPDVYDMDVMPPEQFRTGKFITVGLRTQIRQAQAAGYRIPVARTILITGLADDEIWVNMSRVSGVDSTRPESYTYGEIEGRKQIYEIARYLREFVPGFADARIEKYPREPRDRGQIRPHGRGHHRVSPLRRCDRRGGLSGGHPPRQGRRLHDALLRRQLRYSLPLPAARTGGGTAGGGPLLVDEPRGDGFDARHVDLHGVGRSGRTRRTAGLEGGRAARRPRRGGAARRIACDGRRFGIELPD